MGVIAATMPRVDLQETCDDEVAQFDFTFA